MSPRPRKEDRHDNLEDAIKRTAWSQITTFGAATLNLRAIARQLQIAAPSIYHYFPSRDDLVTALIVDAYYSLSYALTDALEANRAEPLQKQLVELGLAYRQWGIDYTDMYLLIFGTPIPKFHAPELLTAPAGEQAMAPLLTLIDKIHRAGLLRVDRLPAPSPKLVSMLLNWRAITDGVDLEVLYLTLIIWGRVHGLVMLEINHHFPPFLNDGAELFMRELNAIQTQYM